MAAATVDGILLVDKPVGVTSHDVVATVRRARGRIRTGHTGTLDPFASGLLLVTCGRATRLARFLPSDPKVYRASIEFGAATDTDDHTGAVVATGPLPDEPSIRRAIRGLTGALDQVPPAFSAKHKDGQRAYRLARQGVDPALPPVRVRVDDWEVLDWTPPLLVAVITCGAGTYIRALARDLGRAVGSAAHLAGLRRTRIDGFAVTRACAPDESGQAALIPMAAALHGMPRQVLDHAEATAVRHGQTIPARVEAPTVALVDAKGALLAVAERDQDRLHPRVVLDAA